MQTVGPCSMQNRVLTHCGPLPRSPVFPISSSTEQEVPLVPVRLPAARRLQTDRYPRVAAGWAVPHKNERRRRTG